MGISLFHLRTSFLTTHSISECPISLYLCETGQRELLHKLGPDVLPPPTTRKVWAPLSEFQQIRNCSSLSFSQGHTGFCQKHFLNLKNDTFLRKSTYFINHLQLRTQYSHLSSIKTLKHWEWFGKSQEDEPEFGKNCLKAGD